MISAELIGRAYGALSVSGNGGPCVGVLRELVEAVEAEGGVGTTFPVLLYRSRGASVNLSTSTPEDLVMRVRGAELLASDLAIMDGLLDHASGTVEAARIALVEPQDFQDRSATGEQDPAGSDS